MWQIALLFSFLGILLLPTNAQDDVYTRVTYHQARGHYQQALYHVHRLALQTGWTPQTHRLAGDLWRAMGDPNRALTHWEFAQPDAGLWRVMASFYMQQERWGRALDAIEASLGTEPNDAWANFHAALILAPGDPVAAQAYLQRVAANENPYSTDALRLLQNWQDLNDDAAFVVATRLADLRLWAFAEQAFRMVVAQTPPAPEAMAFVGLMRDQQGEDGRMWVQRAVALAPGNADVRYVQGLHLRQIGHYDESADVLLQAITLAPENPLLYAELGMTYRQMGLMEEAAEWVEVALDISEDAPEMRRIVNDFYAEQAAFLPRDATQTLAQQAQGNDPAVLSAYGWALHNIGESQQGLVQIDRALDLRPGYPRALYDKARILIATENAAARPLLEELAQGSSEYAQSAQLLLERLP